MGNGFLWSTLVKAAIQPLNNRSYILFHNKTLDAILQSQLSEWWLSFNSWIKYLTLGGWSFVRGSGDQNNDEVRWGFVAQCKLEERGSALVVRAHKWGIVQQIPQLLYFVLASSYFAVHFFNWVRQIIEQFRPCIVRWNLFSIIAETVEGMFRSSKFGFRYFEMKS